jgi:hypothetical protein
VRASIVILLIAAGVLAADLPTLSFCEFFDPSARELKPSARLLGLKGKRVRLVGFMANMELPPRGAFYLTPRPIACDEAGGGTADLPPEAVLVLVRSRAGESVPFSPRALEVTGVLDLGPREEEDGRTSMIRLTLDRPPDVPRTRKQSQRSADRGSP